LKINYSFHKGHIFAFRKPHEYSPHCQTHFFKIRVNMNQKESDRRGKLHFEEE